MVTMIQIVVTMAAEPAVVVKTLVVVKDTG
jgi:hypothetical protein